MQHSPCGSQPDSKRLLLTGLLLANATFQCLKNRMVWQMFFSVHLASWTNQPHRQPWKTLCTSQGVEINQTDAYLLCCNTCPWLQPQADLEFEGRKPNRESPPGSEKAKDNIWGEGNERRQCIHSGLEETISNRNITMLHVHWQSTGTFIVLSAAQCIRGI